MWLYVSKQCAGNSLGNNEYLRSKKISGPFSFLGVPEEHKDM